MVSPQQTPDNTFFNLCMLGELREIDDERYDRRNLFISIFKPSSLDHAEPYGAKNVKLVQWVGGLTSQTHVGLSQLDAKLLNTTIFSTSCLTTAASVKFESVCDGTFRKKNLRLS